MPDKLEKEILQDVLTPAMVSDIWSANYPEVIPFSLQQFSVGALLPAVFYMFRRGYRRGQGNFGKEFAPLLGETDTTRGSAKNNPTVASVARVLSSDAERFAGFDGAWAQNILADFLLAHCLENQRHESGRKKPVIRAFPTHYHAAWIDLPRSVGHLRLVPESIVAMLADQTQGESIEAAQTADSLFRVGDDFTGNILLSVFGEGMSTREQQTDLVDEFDESVDLALDELVTIRIARRSQQPTKLREAARTGRSLGEGRGTPEIPNQRPIARRATVAFHEDMGLFLQSFGRTIPRQTLTQMLESCIALGLSNLFLSTAAASFEWESEGRLPETDRAWPLLVDCSSGADFELRRLSEEVMDDCTRRLHRLPVIFMVLRILDWQVRAEIRPLPPKRPDATARINLLGDVLFERHQQSRDILRDLRKSCFTLADRLKQEDLGEVYRGVLDDEVAIPNPAWRLAEAVTQMMGDSVQVQHVHKCLNSCLMVGQANGLADERRVQFQSMRNGKKTGMMRSIILTDTMLDFLVHRHLLVDRDSRGLPQGGCGELRALSFNDFVSILRARYGLLVDQAPAGQNISQELLQRNRQFLERRLRSLGLLMGVNDAESMKRLRARFEAQGNGGRGE